jgi:hypothetical protein
MTVFAGFIGRVSFRGRVPAKGDMRIAPFFKPSTTASERKILRAVIFRF